VYLLIRHIQTKKTAKGATLPLNTETSWNRYRETGCTANSWTGADQRHRGKQQERVPVKASNHAKAPLPFLFYFSRFLC